MQYDDPLSNFAFDFNLRRCATESQGRIQTSTATVAVMPEVDEVEVKIAAEDIQLTTARSGGAGGRDCWVLLVTSYDSISLEKRGFKLRFMTWRALSMDSARHVIGCHVTPVARVQNAFDDVASTIHQSLAGGQNVNKVETAVDLVHKPTVGRCRLTLG